MVLRNISETAKFSPGQRRYIVMQFSWLRRISSSSSIHVKLEQKKQCFSEIEKANSWSRGLPTKGNHPNIQMHRLALPVN